MSRDAWTPGAKGVGVAGSQSFPPPQLFVSRCCVRTLGRKNLPGNHSRPTWCTRGGEHFATIVDYARPTFPENIIFHRPNGTSPPHSSTT